MEIKGGMIQDWQVPCASRAPSWTACLGLCRTRRKITGNNAPSYYNLVDEAARLRSACSEIRSDFSVAPSLLAWGAVGGQAKTAHTHDTSLPFLANSHSVLLRSIGPSVSYLSAFFEPRYLIRGLQNPANAINKSGGTKRLR
jgi:hypothetical protein